MNEQKQAYIAPIASTPIADLPERQVLRELNMLKRAIENAENVAGQILARLNCVLQELEPVEHLNCEDAELYVPLASEIAISRKQLEQMTSIYFNMLDRLEL